MVSLETIPVPVDKFTVREIVDETIFMADEGDELHTLDEVGTFIWKAIDGNRTLQNILDCICDEYDIQREIAEKDLIQFISKLAEKGIVEIDLRQS